MADAIISIVVTRIAAVIEDQIRYEVNLVRGVEKEVLDLSNKLETIKNVLDDAEKRGVNENSVKRWLKKLEETAYEMDDILDEWNYTLLKHKMGGDRSTDPDASSTKQKVCCSFFPFSRLCFKKVSVKHHTASKIENVKATLDQILKEKDDFNFVMSLAPTNHVPESWRVQSTSSIGEVCGRDIYRNKNDIVRKLMLDDDSQTLCIVGMGGLGKTTLAQLVYNDSRVKDCFELRVWICVSDPFDVASIARGIVDSVGTHSSPSNTNQLELVLQKLRDCISGKKFLLVLDDVWTEDYNKWEPLENILKYGLEGSKIMVTTRKQGVPRMMRTTEINIYRPQQLSDEECWSLLRQISLFERKEEECEELEDVGKKIASKCKGLPLAAKVLGSLLQSKKSLEEWENVLESEIWRLEKAKVDLFPHLLLSYNELSPALKRCFSYCAVYPKDYRINAERLIEEWMALGYLGSVSENDGVEAKGRDYFNYLTMHSLFQDFEKKKGSESIEWCKMHDIVHDFAQFLRIDNGMTKRSCQACDPTLPSLAQEYRSLILDSSRSRSRPNLCVCLTSLRVISIIKRPLGGMEKLIHLRRLEIAYYELDEEDFRIISRLYFLQTLVLEECRVSRLPREIGNLVHLRHLNLFRNPSLKELPDSICSLVELQILNIGCCLITQLPEGIHRLQNLKHLILVSIFDSRKGYLFPQGLAQLSGLRSLTPFYGGRGWNKLGLLKNLKHLTGTLKLEIHFSYGSDLKELVNDAREAELSNKTHIQTLKLRFKKNEEKEEERSLSSSLWMDVIEALEPYHKLKTLKIRDYMGCRLPDWISSPHTFIKEIYLKYMNEVSSLPPMGKLPFLEVLFIKKLMKMKHVGREFLGLESSSSTNDGVVVFPKLKQLTFRGCEQWEEWEDITAEEEESNLVSIMPSITELFIYECGGLKNLPHRLLRKVSSSLQILLAYLSRELNKIYGEEEEDGSPFRSMCRNNSQLRVDFY